MKGSSTGEVCQITPSSAGQLVPGVYRPGIYRAGIYRPGIYRRPIIRRPACNAKHECSPTVTVPMVTVPTVSIPMVRVPMATLQSRTAGQSQELKGGGTVAYDIKADVLFDFGKAEIKPAAATELARVAATIKKETPLGAVIQVDGHTDAKGDPASNQRLSQQRAAAIVEWLVAKGGIDRARLKSAGYGETKPVASNTKPNGSDDPEGRAKNRRVVISAKQS